MALSTALPAGTIIRTRRGVSSASIKAVGNSTPVISFPAASPSREGFCFGKVQVVAGYRKAVAFHVQGQAVAHHSQANHAYFVFHVSPLQSETLKVNDL